MNHSHPALLGIAIVVFAVPELARAAESKQRPAEYFEFSSYTEVKDLFETLSYTPQKWQAGIREVPRVYLTNIAPRWRDRVSNEVSVQTKKRLFFRALAPLALHSNEFILKDRRRVKDLAAHINNGQTLSAEDKAWFNEVAARYRVVGPTNAQVDKKILTELLARVDIVPLSLTLSQSAEESGWGTSRFAAVGNALFGQWTWSSKGIKPEGQRQEFGDHRIAAFETPLESVMSYMHNLNTHQAYTELRAVRAEMRRTEERISGWKLAENLLHYSERGEAYVKSLQTIMRVNQLDAADDAYLGNGPTIFLIPVSGGAP